MALRKGVPYPKSAGGPVKLWGWVPHDSPEDVAASNPLAFNISLFRWTFKCFLLF